MDAARIYDEIVREGAEETATLLAAKRLGEFYEQGLGVEKNLLKAEEYYLIAGDRGNDYFLHELAIKSYTDKFRE